MIQDQGALSETERIAALRQQLAKSVNRIDSLQASKSWSARVSDHLRRNSNGIINLALASSVFAVALGRLAMKSQHEVGYSSLAVTLLPCLRCPRPPSWLAG